MRSDAGGYGELPRAVRAAAGELWRLPPGEGIPSAWGLPEWRPPEPSRLAEECRWPAGAALQHGPGVRVFLLSRSSALVFSEREERLLPGGTCRLGLEIR